MTTRRDMDEFMKQREAWRQYEEEEMRQENERILR
jgi:hypothetical protein